MRHLPVLFIAIALAAWCTAPGTSNVSQAASPPQVLAPELRDASIDSVVQFLLTAAATDFRHHGPSGPIRFRRVRIGHVVTPDSEKQYRLCGQFLRAEEEGKSQWTPFVTIKTSGYEQYIGGSSYCQDSLVIWDKVGDLSSALQSRL